MNSITQHIRPANSTDAAMLQVLVRDCVGAMRAAGIEQWDEVYPNAKTIARDMEAGTLHILEDGKSIVAIITIDQYLDPLWQGMDWTGDSEPAAAVHRLMVRPSQQGRGLAKMLMLHAETVARELGCRSIRLDSFLQNPAAMALYPLLGYRQTGTAMMRKGEFVGFEKVLPIRAMASAHIPAALEL